MKKIISVAMTVLVLSVALVGCKGSKQPDDTNTTQVKLSATNTYEYAVKLGEAALDAYLGKEYDTVYGSALLNIKTLESNPEKIYLENAARLTISRMLGQATLNAVILPGFYPTENPNPPGFSLDEEFQAALFPEGTAPPIQPMTEFGDATPEFERWFLARAVQAGLLDERLKIEGDKVYVYSAECTPEKGGTTFKVFDTTYTLDELNFLDTAPMVLKSYRYYDTGKYTATYITDPELGKAKPVEIDITFIYREVTGNYESAVERYLAGITNLTVVQREVK